MLKNEYKQAKTKGELQTICISNVLYYQYMDFFFTYFSHVFLIFDCSNFDIGIIVLRSSISVQVSKNVFGTIKRGGGVQISIGGFEKNSKINKRRGGTFIWHTRVSI